MAKQRKKGQTPKRPNVEKSKPDAEKKEKGSQLSASSDQPEAESDCRLTECAAALDDPARVVVILPVGEIDPIAHVARHVDVKLSPDQATTLRRLFNATRGEELANGRFVQSHGDAVKWLLEQIDERRHVEKSKSRKVETAG